MVTDIAQNHTAAYGRSMSKRLSQTDWIKAGFRALTKGGPDAIRVEALARSLGVSKGSFYWHFADAPALKAAMLDHWQRVATDQIITQTDSHSPTAKDRLRRLVDLATQDVEDEYGGNQAEAAIRDWARYSPEAATRLQQVDQHRLRYLETLFKEASPAAPAQNARLLYAALIGLEALSTAPATTRTNDLQCLLATLLETKLAAVTPPG